MNKIDLLDTLYKEIHSCHICPDVEESISHRLVDKNAIESKIVLMAQAPARGGVRKSGKHWVKTHNSLTRGGIFLEPYLNLIGYSVDHQNNSITRPYTTNALHCWTGKGKNGDRRPRNEELCKCMKWWNSELDIINPDFLILLGEQPVRAISLLTNNKKLIFKELIKSSGYEIIEYKDKPIKLFVLPHPSIRPANKYYKIREAKYNEVFNTIKELL